MQQIILYFLISIKNSLIKINFDFHLTFVFKCFSQNNPVFVSIRFFCRYWVETMVLQ